MLQLLKRFREDKRGVVAITFAALMIPIILFSGIALDFNRALSVRRHLDHALDATAIAGATINHQRSTRMTTTRNTFYAQLVNRSSKDYEVQNLSIQFNDQKQELVVSYKARVPMIFSGFSGRTHQDVRNEVATSYYSTYQPVSIGMVLDVSGSMGWRVSNRDRSIRLNVLKAASNSLLTILGDNDPDNELVRTAAITYSSYIRSTWDFRWGTSYINQRIRQLYAGGGTNSSGAMWDMAPRIYAERNRHTYDNPLRFVIFMTDGENNRTSYDTTTLQACTHIKDQGTEIYAVNFGGGTRAVNMMRACASSPENFFNTGTSADFIAAFENIAGKIMAKRTRLLR